MIRVALLLVLASLASGCFPAPCMFHPCDSAWKRARGLELRLCDVEAPPGKARAACRADAEARYRELVATDGAAEDAAP